MEKLRLLELGLHPYTKIPLQGVTRKLRLSDIDSLKGRDASRNLRMGQEPVCTDTSQQDVRAAKFGRIGEVQQVKGAVLIGGAAKPLNHTAARERCSDWDHS